MLPSVTNASATLYCALTEFMLSTSDNPFNPFNQFDEWFAFDTAHGYNTLSYLAKIAETTEDGFDRENRLAINDAIEDAIRFNLTGNRIKVENTTK